MEAEQAVRRLPRALRHARRGKCRRLLALLSRYGEAIEADLTWRGVDLGGLWRTRRWRQLLNLIDHLPRDSHYVEALASDDTLAEAALAAKAGPQTPLRRLAEWSPEVEALAAVVDRLTELIGVQVVRSGGKPPTFQPYLRPVTAMDKARARQQAARHRALVARLIPPEEGA